MKGFISRWDGRFRNRAGLIPPKMPISSLISLNVILCETILQERDLIFSAVRIVDVFYFKRSVSDPTIGEPIKLSVLAMGKT